MRPRPQAKAERTVFIERFRNHPAVLFWKSADEPEWGKFPVAPLKEAHELIHRLDPNPPVWFCHVPRGTLETLPPPTGHDVPDTAATRPGER